MPIPNVDHLLDQAERLYTPPLHGPPRQADLRRSISTAYYALFHRIAIATADEFVGASLHSSSRHALLYRSLGHRVLCYSLVDGRFAVDASRRAIRNFDQAAPDERQLFLTLLLCPPR